MSKRGVDGQRDIVPEDPRADGVAAGQALGAAKLRAQCRDWLASPGLRDTLGAMGEAELHAYVLQRLHTPPDTSRFPELGELYPDRVDALRGLAEGAGVSLAAAACHDYLRFRAECDSWWRSLQVARAPEEHCSGILLVGPDGVLGAQSAESLPLEPPPANWVTPQPPQPPAPLRIGRPKREKLVLKRPRTGYIAQWGVASEAGVACVAANSCSTWLDEPIADTWPLQQVPLARFASSAAAIAELYQRYTLHNWGRASQIWADTRGDAVVIEKSFRRVGVRRLNGASAI